MKTIQFGDTSWELEIPPEKLCSFKSHPDSDALKNLQELVPERLDNPTGFPALRTAVVPGDHIALVVDWAVPQLDSLLTAIVEYLIDCDVNPKDIQVIHPTPIGTSLLGLDDQQIPSAIQFIQHDSRDRTQLSYLATTTEDHRIYLNRNVVDADVVLLVGRICYDRVMGYRGTTSTVYPGLADVDTQNRFRSQLATVPATAPATSWREESDEVGWLLGALFAVQIIPGGEGEILELFVGKCDSVQSEGQKSLDSLWTRNAAIKSDLVIAVVTESADRTGFDELAAAVHAATRLLSPGGRAVLLTNLDRPAPPGLKSAAQFEQPIDWMKQLSKNLHEDSAAAFEIALACSDARVYLASGLNSDLVENSFMTPIESDQELQRLISVSDKCHIISGAHLARVLVEGHDVT